MTAARSRVVLWAAFALVHLWLGFLALNSPGYPIGDVTLVYKHWTDQALVADYWVGIDGVFVYPLLALLPMLAATVLGGSLYATSWLVIVTLVNAVGFGAITGWRRSADRAAVAWWWLGFLVLLGPIALVRIDSITVPLAVVGVLLLATRPRAAMSSLKEVSLEKLFSTRAATKVPAPWRRESKPSATRPSKALRTVIRDTDSSAARSRAAGRA